VQFAAGGTREQSLALHDSDFAAHLEEATLPLEVPRRTAHLARDGEDGAARQFRRPTLSSFRRFAQSLDRSLVRAECHPSTFDEEKRRFCLTMGDKFVSTLRTMNHFFCFIIIILILVSTMNHFIILIVSTMNHVLFSAVDVKLFDSQSPD